MKKIKKINIIYINMYTQNNFPSKDILVIMIDRKIAVTLDNCNLIIDLSIQVD